MQILKVLLVVLVAVNLSNGLFFKKKKKVYVHHPPPPPVYAPVPQYTYSYYYQPVPYYYYEPVYVTPQQHPTPAPYSANTHPVQSSGRQALPAFDAANFNGKPEVEIVPSVGFQMGTKTDVIEVLKSPGVEVPVQPVQTDAGSTTVLIDELNPDNDVKLSSGGVIPIANAQASSASSFSSTDLLLNSVPTVIDVGSRGSFDGRSGKRGAGTVEVFKSPGEYIEFPPVSIQNDDDAVSALLTDQAFLPTNSELSSSVNTFSASQSFAQSQALTSTIHAPELDGVGAAASSDSVAVAAPPAEDALAFPEVRQVLHELLNTKKFDETRFKKDTTTSGGVPVHPKAVQIDPQVSYSKVARQ